MRKFNLIAHTQKYQVRVYLFCVIEQRDRQWDAFVQPLLHCCSGKAILITQPECICSLSYPACNAHAPYWHLWPAPLYIIFPYYLINGTIIEKKVTKDKCVFWFCLQLLSETFLTLTKNERVMIKIVCWCSCKYPLILSDFNDTWSFSTDFLKILKYKIS